MNNLDQFGLKPLTITDRPFIDRILSPVETMLSAYTFVSHYLWRDIFHYHWDIIDDYFCLFAQYDNYFYMPLPPVPCHDKEGLRGISFKAFSLMQAVNKNKAVSRIENIAESQTEAFISIGYDVKPGEVEYVYLREDLANLKGDSYKSKRAVCNHFIKNYTYSYEPFQARFADDCIQLYDLWQKRKKAKIHDSFSTALSEDASLAHRQAIMQYEALQLTGRIVRIHNRVEGYLFGFKKRGDIFCILLEITNPAIRGLAQFIFREFCREMGGYTYINALGDSGLENLRRVKLSYRPCTIVPSYIACLP